MDKTFEPAAVEARVAAQWEARECFKAGRPDRAGAEPYTIVIPPPNVTGSLHMGHALNNTLQDVLCRFERMRGRDVLWQPGTDHAGIATQMVVERRLMETQQPGRRDLGREKFVEKVWEQKAESESIILGQLRRLGASCDWSRTRFTMDEGLSKAVLKVFVDLYNDGLIYRDKRLVNWDPKFQSAISDLEVEQIEVKGHLWHFNYPLADKTYNASDPSTYITVATTRPETMLGDTAVAVHPEDERWKPLIGKMVRLPLVGRLIPIVGDEYSDPEKGSGAVKITPAHDFNDFDVGRRHKLPLVNIFDAEAQMLLRDNEDFLAGAQASPDLDEVLALNGQDRVYARKQIVAMMEARGFLQKVEPHVHMVPHGDRSNAPIEPYLTDQWYVNVKPLAEKAMEAVREGRTRIVPENWEKTYFQWLENIEPWCVSRQLWWGHQIPAWYGPDGRVFVAESEEHAIAAALAYYVEEGVIDDFGGADLARDPEKLANFLTRDEDVLDTWFSSALWPFSTLGWPDETPEVARYYPTNALVTGFDIIFFWVARMMMMGLHFMEEVPFRDVYIHALVRDEKGAKMSKSKGNVIDPLKLIDDYGADALRFTLTAMAAQGRDIKLSINRVDGYKSFATKLWNAARFAEMNGCERVASFNPRAAKETLNVWAIGECAEAAAEVTSAIEAYRFNDAAAAIYRFTWNIFCDWYLELSKPVLSGEEGAAKQETRATVAFLIDEICKLLHPFMPFLTEELWAIKGGAAGRPQMLALTEWPDLAGLENEAAEQEIGFVVDLISEIRSVRVETNVPAGAQVGLVMVGAGVSVEDAIARWKPMIARLARLSDISFASAAPAQSAQIIVRGATAALPLEGVVDLGAESARLTKEIAKLQQDVAKIDAKLGNRDFIARAPEEVVEEQRDRKDEALARMTKIGDALKRLAG
ncbi:valine--tRNA ligase [Terrarubrum flagellatum]|uniref:valine--tRNA ligase n=1 Tax=Terrirubrum flagellatum TaxID=2895980 RepID=UPI00314543AC